MELSDRYPNTEFVKLRDMNSRVRMMEINLPHTWDYFDEDDKGYNNQSGNGLSFNPLKAKFAYVIFKNSARTSKRTPHFIITKMKWLMLFKKIISVYTENHAKPINTKYSVTDC
jgi:hypothetical protein